LQSSDIPVVQAGYDRAALRPRILHLGFGAFARAHPLLYTDLALAETRADWGVVAARLNTGAEELSALDQADGRYTVVITSDQGISARRVGCIVRTLHPGRDGKDVIPDLMASPALGIVTLTITEKGYCLAGDELDLSLPGIRYDLESPQSPKTAIGTIVEGLNRRRLAGLGGLTILSCDNLPANGHACHTAVLALARLRDAALADWIADTCTFPCSMVDRIVPAMSDESHALLTRILGHPDPNGILCEPFRQWVIEDDFAAGRPDWHLAGAEFVDDVAPFEEVKLRMLNGSHSCLAYLGALAGHETVADCMQDPLFRAAARRLMLSEQAPTLRVPDHIDLTAYADRLIERFSNSHLHHRTIQIAADGSQKLPQRLLAPIADHLRNGTPWPLSALAIAGWMRFLRGQAEDGAPLTVQDPLTDTLTLCAKEADGNTYVDALLALEQVFPTDLAANSEFRSLLHNAYRTLATQGAQASLTQTMQPEKQKP
jgi:fructuronate reductase